MSKTEKTAPGKKVGRPSTGKKAYCIRMTPTTNAALLKAAKVAGYSQLGDWLDSLPVARAAMNARISVMSAAERASAFRIGCENATKSLSIPYEVIDQVIDHDPRVGKSGMEAFRRIKERYASMVQLA